MFAAVPPCGALSIELFPDAAMATAAQGTVAVLFGGDFRDLDRIKRVVESSGLIDTAPDALCPVWRARDHGPDRLLVWARMAGE